MSTPRRLSQLLVTSHIGLILLFALLLLATGVGTIRAAVVGQARTEAERAVSEARTRLQEWRRELTVAADLLAEHPTLIFYLERGQVTKTRELVADFHSNSDVDYLRVEWDGRTLAVAGPEPPAVQTGLAFDENGTAWQVLRRGIASQPRASLVLAEQLGTRLMAPSGGELLDVRLQPPMSSPNPADDPWSSALYRVSESGEPATVENMGGAAAARIVSLRDSSGTTRALLSARVRMDWVQRRILEWLAAFGGSVLATFGFALVLATFIAKRIARPFAQLAGEAERLGGGDLLTPIPRPETFLAEPAALAASLEQMREQLAELTAAERRQRDELDAILDGVDEGIAGLGADDRIHYANRQFLQLTGRTRDQVLGHRLDEILFPINSTAATDGLPPAERYRAASAKWPLIVRRLGGGAHRVIVVREENAYEVARAMRDRILANLSHEFQTPLSAQMASIELLRDHLKQGSDRVALRLADAQFRGTIRLSQLVENLLESVRIESGEMRLRQQPVDLASVVEEAIELMQPLVDQRDQRVVADIQPGPSVTGDAQRLLSVVVNLLSNANKFAPDQTVIRVRTQWGAKWVTVWVEDEGPGLPPSLTAHDLFAPFRRAPHEEPSQRGTGLGLAIVHAIVAAHGGKVRVESSGQRGGVRIGIVLPHGETDAHSDRR
ncbi:sensor histidine kinase [Lysobacter niastensis]|uniref:histidine kinase n=1 Tax=Lysobacter niastensis TaxID=380629 RepID=A0ABS0B7E3_9GAMM|nr:ATP-binding protein [Lysobacter niastensis]MBF6024920.1 PAS domain-containing protein [Lysobacter niastensis]